VTTDVQLVPKLKMGGALPQTLHMGAVYKGKTLFTFSLKSFIM
jgi:hypothetical protein